MKELSKNYRRTNSKYGGFRLEYLVGDEWVDCGLNFDDAYVLDPDLNVAVAKEHKSGEIYLLVQGQYNLSYNMCVETKDGVYLFARLNKEGKPETMSADGKWNMTAVDPKNHIVGDPFATYQDYCGPRPLDYGRVLFDDKMAIDPEGNIIDASKLDILQNIYDKPTDFLGLKKEDFANKTFIDAAILSAKNGIRKDVEKFDTVPKAYADWVEEFCSKVKETTTTTYESLKENPNSKTSKEESDAAKKSIENILGGF